MTRTWVMNWLMLGVSCATVASSREKAFSPIRVTLVAASGGGGEGPGGGGGVGGGRASRSITHRGVRTRWPGRTPDRLLSPPAWRGCSSRRRGRRCSSTVPAQDWLRARQTPLPPRGGAVEEERNTAGRDNGSRNTRGKRQ